MIPPMPSTVIAVALLSSGVTLAADTGTALRSHNQVRERVNTGAYPAEPAAHPPLAPLGWDQALAKRAGLHAERCVWTHDDDRTDEGENLAYSTKLTFGINEAVLVWADERKGYDHASGACVSEPCGHYTQLVWRDTLRVGCGQALCTPLRRPSGAPLAAEAVFHVCRYSPAGNVEGERPYAAK
jgi:hypothetical protein